jgi:hypothetical protein
MSACPKGHLSVSTDYCDDCGTPMAGLPLAGLGHAAMSCPECSAARESGARFCEVCQHDFQQGVGGASDSRLARSDALARQGLADLGAPAMASSSPAHNAILPALPRAPSFRPASIQPPMLARIHADPALAPDEESRASFPHDGIADRIFHLDLDENMVGRESASKNAHPEITLRDPGASRRHLKIARVDGSFHALELGSSNGTLLDGLSLEPGVPAPLREGSVLRIGIWTTIRIESR